MKRCTFTAILIITAVFLSSALVFSNPDEINWLYSYDQAVQMSKSTGKTLMIYFYTDWQEWCKKMDEETFANPAVVELSRKFICLKINGEKDKAINDKYHVHPYPTIVFVAPDGKEINRVVSFSPAEDFLKEMQKAVR